MKINLINDLTRYTQILYEVELIIRKETKKQMMILME